MRNDASLRCTLLALCVLAAAIASCRTEPSLAELRVAARDSAPPHLEKRTKVDRQTGRLIREWSVLVYADKPPQKQGVETVFYSSGSKEWSREFDHGQPKGAWRSWYEDGKPRSECFFGDPNVDTIMTWWYPGGHIQSRGPARNGAHRGLWRYYYKSGQVAEEGQYFDNQKSGEWRAWSEDGQVVTLRKYAKGVRVSEKPGPSVAAGATPATKTAASASAAKSNVAPSPVAPPMEPLPTPKPPDDPDEDERPPK
jgi:hypothetical protein